MDFALNSVLPPFGGRCLMLAASVLMSSSLFGALPRDVASQIAGHLPAAFAPIPMMSTKMIPTVSEKLHSLDRSNAVDTGQGPMVIEALSQDGKMVRVKVPPKKKGGGWVSRWFRADDVFNGVEWKLERYEAPCQCLIYNYGGKHPLELIGRMQAGDVCASLGTVKVGAREYRLLQRRCDTHAGGAINTFSIVLGREAPPVKTQEQYDRRAAEFLAEYAFRDGRDWGTMFPAILTREGAYECAAMASDFACYMFGTGLGAGELYTDAKEIRTGDIVYFKNHYIAIVYRNGNRLHTIEGNINKTVSQSKTRYSIINGRFCSGGKPREFVRGRHNWPALRR